MSSPLLPLDPVVARWHDSGPTLSETGAKTWISRAANFVVSLTSVETDAKLIRQDNPDEYVVLSQDAPYCVTTPEKTLECPAGSLTIVPPGPSEVSARGKGEIVRIFSSQARDMMLAATNADAYPEAPPLVAPLVSWPAPLNGYELKNFILDDYVKPGSLMRIFRTRNLMVNVLLPWESPRDVKKLSPHSHADFEQGSLALASRWKHHLRFPWTPDMTAWREDEHVEVGSPSLTVIPPTVIHTSHNLDPQGLLVDIFAPPRVDFSRTPGLVINSDDYPMPTDA